MENGYATRELVRDVLGRPELRLVPHIGYVSLFPFMRRIIPSVSCMEHLLLKQHFISSVAGLCYLCSMVW